jgi:transcriptional regulator with XRE-family HTH domain
MPKSLHTSAYEHFLAELRDAREQAGLTQVQLAEKLGVDQTFVSKGERGVRRLDIVELRGWLQAMRIDLPDFVDKFERRLHRHRAPSNRG